MKAIVKRIITIIEKTPAAPVCKRIHDLLSILRYYFVCIGWYLKGYRKPTREEAGKVEDNVTFIYKSFERQHMAKRLYRNIRHYYPNARIIISDDSKKPLRIRSKNLQIIQLPFNSGLSRGIGRALEKSDTPYTMRLDDDVLLTPFSGIHKQLDFLVNHREADLVGISACPYPMLKHPQDCAKEYYPFDMRSAGKELIIPHMTKLDDSHIVLGKVPNIFLARTKEYKAIGYDDHIRMIDHHEFFMRAAGNLVSVLDTDAFVYHYHDRFDLNYRKYRKDYLRDIEYIKAKHRKKSSD